MSDQQEFPEDPSEYADPENVEHHSTGKGLALPGQNLPDKVYIIPIHNLSLIHISEPTRPY